MRICHFNSIGSVVGYLQKTKDSVAAIFTTQLADNFGRVNEAALTIPVISAQSILSTSNALGTIERPKYAVVVLDTLVSPLWSKIRMSSNPPAVGRWHRVGEQKIERQESPLLYSSTCKESKNQTKIVFGATSTAIQTFCNTTANSVGIAAIPYSDNDFISMRGIQFSNKMSPALITQSSPKLKIKSIPIKILDYRDNVITIDSTALEHEIELDDDSFIKSSTGRLARIIGSRNIFTKEKSSLLLLSPSSFCLDPKDEFIELVHPIDRDLKLIKPGLILSSGKEPTLTSINDLPPCTCFVTLQSQGLAANLDPNQPFLPDFHWLHVNMVK